MRCRAGWLVNLPAVASTFTVTLDRFGATELRVSRNGGRSGRVEAEADHSLRVDPDDLRGHALHERRLIGQGLGAATDFHAADPPRLDRGEVIHDEGHIRVRVQVAELARGSQAEPADVDGPELSVVPEADRVVLGRAAGVHGREPAEPLRAQVRDDLGRQASGVFWHDVMLAYRDRGRAIDLGSRNVVRTEISRLVSDRDLLGGPAPAPGAAAHRP